LPNSPVFVLSAHLDAVALSKPERRGLPDDIKPGKTANFTVYDIDKSGNVYYYMGDSKEKPSPVTAISMKYHFDDYDNDSRSKILSVKPFFSLKIRYRICSQMPYSILSHVRSNASCLFSQRYYETEGGSVK
jgi:hypothetical protein